MPSLPPSLSLQELHDKEQALHLKRQARYAFIKELRAGRKAAVAQLTAGRYGGKEGGREEGREERKKGKVTDLFFFISVVSLYRRGA
jgi:hypothetical protein